MPSDSSGRPQDQPLARLLGSWTTRIVAVRWGVAGVLLLMGLWGPGGRSAWPPDGVFLLGLGVLAYNVLFVVSLIRGQPDRPALFQSTPRLAFWQVTFDWLALMLLLFLTGGPINPITFLFVFHVVLSAVYLPPHDCLLSGAAAALVLVLGTVLEILGTQLPHSRLWGELAISASPMQTAVFVASLLAGYSLTIFVTHLLGNRLWLEEHVLSETNRHLAQWRERARILNQMSVHINRARGHDVYQKTVEAATRVCQAPAASLRIDHEGTGTLVLTASTGLSEEYLEKGAVRLADSPLDQRVMAGELVSVADILAEEVFQYPDQAAREGVRAVLCAPVAVEGKALGVLRVYDRRVRVFGDLAKEFVTGLAGLAAVAVQKEKTLEALERRDETMREFTVSATHALRSPLAATQNLMDLLLEGYTGEISDQQKEILSRARRRIDHLLVLVRELLFYTTRELEGTRGPEEAVDLRAVIEAEAAKAREMAEEKHLTFEILIEVGSRRIRGVREEIARIVTDLIHNAITYTPAPGRVVVRLEDTPSGYLLSVEDTGIGIEPEYQAMVWKEFFRTPRARAHTELGTGLGLALVKRVLDRMGGQVTLESTPGQGTTVKVWFPARLRVAAGAPAEALPPGPTDPTGA